MGTKLHRLTLLLKLSIRVEFSISDLNLMNSNEMEDNALYEDESGDIAESAPPKSGKDSRSAAEQDEDDDDFMEDETSPEPSFPAHLSIVVEKVRYCCNDFQISPTYLFGHFANDFFFFFFLKLAHGWKPKDLWSCSRWHDYPSECCVSPKL